VKGDKVQRKREKKRKKRKKENKNQTGKLEFQASQPLISQPVRVFRRASGASHSSSSSRDGVCMAFYYIR
jgi:hypothetical protein